MSESVLPRVARRRISFTILVSVILALAVVLPLVITILGSELFLRPNLLSQAATEMQNDAQAHVQTIDAYLIARSQDVGFLGRFLAIQKYLAGDMNYQAQASSELKVGYGLDANFVTWALFDKQGNLRLSFPTKPAPRGKYMIEPGALQQLQGVNKLFFSDVYFDNATNAAFVDIYSSITDANGKVLGFGRATLNLNTVWTAVNSENNTAPGNYAMILDGHGVRIAYTNPDTTLTTRPMGLFKAVAPLPSTFQQRVSDENLYGNASSPVKVVPDTSLASMITSTSWPTTFQETPALQTESYQLSKATSRILPWTYVVLRPVSTVTNAADQQQNYLFVISALVTILAILVGLFVGQSITRPILRSVTSLLRNSRALKDLASREQAIANEQKWVIEASQNGLQSVQYYAEAAGVAAQKLDELGIDLAQNWERYSPQRIKQHLREIVSTAKYIGEASNQQRKSSRNMATAVRVTTQVADQLISGADSATEAASQLDDVVGQLRQVVGQ